MAGMGLEGAYGVAKFGDTLHKLLAEREAARLMAEKTSAAQTQQDVENKQRDRQLSATEASTKAQQDRLASEDAERVRSARASSLGQTIDNSVGQQDLTPAVTPFMGQDNPQANTLIAGLKRIDSPAVMPMKGLPMGAPAGALAKFQNPKPAPVPTPKRESVRQPDLIGTGEWNPALKGQKVVGVFDPDTMKRTGEEPAYIDPLTEQAKQDKLKPMDVSDDVQHTMRGTPYVSLENYTPSEREKVRESARSIKTEDGKPVAVISKEAADGLRAADTARANLDKMLVQVKDKLPTGPGGRVIDGPMNLASKFFQTDEGLGAFGSWRTAAIQTVQSLAEKGMGLRLNRSEIDLALDNDIPKITDTWEVAVQRVKNLNALLDSKEDAALNKDRRSMRVTGGVNDASAPPKDKTKIWQSPTGPAHWDATANGGKGGWVSGG